MIWVCPHFCILSTYMDLLTPLIVDVKAARHILGPNAIIGASVSSPQEALKAVDEDGVDYLGIGTVFATPT